VILFSSKHHFYLGNIRIDLETSLPLGNFTAIHAGNIITFSN